MKSPLSHRLKIRRPTNPRSSMHEQNLRHVGDGESDGILLPTRLSTHQIEIAMKLTGHTILITGGSAGIGLAFALKFIDLGNEVIVTGRRQSKLDEVKRLQPKLQTIQSDVADPAAIAALAAEVKRRFPKFDV